MLKRWFTDHPRSVGETFGEHFGVAARFGLIMLRGGVGALVHALIPRLCQTTGSDALAKLNALMAEHHRTGSAG